MKLTEKQIKYLKMGIEEELEHQVKVHFYPEKETCITVDNYLRNSQDSIDAEVNYMALCNLAEFWETYFEVSPITAYQKEYSRRDALVRKGQETLERGKKE